MKKLIAPLLVFLSVSLASIVVTSCGGTNCKDPQNATTAKCTVVEATVECGGTAVDALVTEQGPGLEQALGSAILSDGSIDYDAAAPTLENYAVKFGMCFVTKVFGNLGNLHFAAAPGSSSTPHATPQALADTLQKFTVTHYTGKKFVAAPGGQ